MMVAMAPPSETRRVVLLAFERLQALDLVGPAEVFSMASRLRKGAYSIDPETGVYSARGFEIDAGRHFRYFNAFHVQGKGEEIA